VKYLVTGGAGFIGSHLVAALRRDGADVRVLDDFSSGKHENLAAIDRLGGSGRIEVIEGDLRNQAIVREAVRGVEVIFHEAAFVSVPASIEDPSECFGVNCTGTLTLLEAARAAAVRRVVLASSAAVYGDSSELPLTETSPARPLSPYAASKLVDEIYATLYTKALDLEVCALRYFNVFGPRQRPDSHYAAAVPIFIRRLLRKEPPTIFGDGGQTRDLISVRDVVRANLTAAAHPAAAGEVFNVCTGRKTRILELVDALRELIPNAPATVFGPARTGDIYESIGSPAKAKAILGFEAETSLFTGLKETVEWMR
jgi:nucleoside-diphosphate-sugar epimerase